MDNKKIFIFSFALMVVIRAIALCRFRQYVPYTGLYILFMFIWGMLILTNKGTNKGTNRQIKEKKVLYVIGLLSVYFVVFAFSNISVLDRSDVLSTMARSLMMVSFVCISAYWISRYNCLKSVIGLTYIFMAIFMTVLFFVYIPQTNLITTISSFWNQYGSMRQRNQFGFMVNNIAAEHALSVILLSFYVIHEYCHKKSAFSAIIIIDDIIMFLVIIANNSRGTLVVCLLILCVYAFLKSIKKNGIKKTVKISTIMILISVIGLALYLKLKNQDLETFLYFTNRMHFLTNYKILAKSGRWFLGLGRTSGAFLAEGNIIYGMKTDYMEIFYVGVFIQTGIIGSIWILITLYILGRRLYIKCRKGCYTDKWIFVIFIYSLTMSLFEDYILSSLYITSTFFLAFMVAYCIKSGEKSNRNTLLLGNLIRL